MLSQSDSDADEAHSEDDEENAMTDNFIGMQCYVECEDKAVNTDYQNEALTLEKTLGEYRESLKDSKEVLEQLWHDKLKTPEAMMEIMMIRPDQLLLVLMKLKWAVPHEDFMLPKYVSKVFHLWMD